MINGLAVATSIVFALSCCEKLIVLREHRASWHPVSIAWPRVRGRATTYFVIGACADLGLAGLLLGRTSRPVAAVVAAGLLLAYWTLGSRVMRLAADHGCECTVLLLDVASRTAFHLRNAIVMCALFVLAVPLPSIEEYDPIHIVAGSGGLLAVHAGLRLTDAISRAESRRRLRPKDRIRVLEGV